MGRGGWVVSSSCGGRELLRAGVPERCRPAGSERWRHLVEGEIRARLLWQFAGSSARYFQ